MKEFYIYKKRSDILFGMLIGFAVSITITCMLMGSHYEKRVNGIEDILMIMVEHDSIQLEHIIDLYEKEL